jgi:peptide chain release factor 1
MDDPDPSMKALATEERVSLATTMNEHISSTFPALLLPPSKTTSFSALLELKSGVGGDEASLFLSEILRMYTRLAASNGLRAEIVSQSDGDGSRGGIKDAILEVSGAGAYDLFRWESGVHRVQRVPATETTGRVHTSTVAVVVLPSADPSMRQEEDGIVNEADVRIDVMRSRGAGGQHVNRTESAVRLTHIPTGITVSMQDSRSQHQNKAKAWQILRARLLDRKMIEEMQKKRAERRDLVRSADRSEKIRTYNFAQDRVTDHRVGMSVSNMTSVLDGDGLMPIVLELQKDYENSVMEDLLDDKDFAS